MRGTPDGCGMYGGTAGKNNDGLQKETRCFVPDSSIMLDWRDFKTDCQGKIRMRLTSEQRFEKVFADLFRMFLMNSGRDFPPIGCSRLTATCARRPR